MKIALAGVVGSLPMGKRLALSFAALLSVALTLAGAAQGTSGNAQFWAFPKSEVLVRERILRQALDQVFPLSVPVKVVCRGLQPIALTAGGKGFRQIRCTTSLSIKDFVYHLDSRGRVYVTRPSKQ